MILPFAGIVVFSGNVEGIPHNAQFKGSSDKYQPEISASFAHDFPQMPLADFRLGPSMSFSHSLGFNRVDWIGNYRKGFDVSANNSYSFNFHQLSKNTESPQDALSLNYSISGIGHFIISDSFGVSAYLQYRHWFTHNPEYNDSAGDVLRGIFNSAVHADYMLSLNLDFPIRAFRFFPSRWAISNKPGFLGWLLRKLDFELHVSPIIDMALYHDPSTDTSFSFKNMLVSGGIELIVFPAVMRSLYLRASVAWNFVDQINNPGDYYLSPVFPIVPHLPSGDNREIFVGIGHHY